jgi:hypothetical protein
MTKALSLRLVFFAVAGSILLPIHSSAKPSVDKYAASFRSGSPLPAPTPSPLNFSGSPLPAPTPSPLMASGSPLPAPTPSPLIVSGSPLPAPTPSPRASGSPLPAPTPSPLVASGSPLPAPTPSPRASGSPLPAPTPSPLAAQTRTWAEIPAERIWCRLKSSEEGRCPSSDAANLFIYGPSRNMLTSPPRESVS